MAQRFEDGKKGRKWKEYRIDILDGRWEWIGERRDIW